MTDKYEAPFEGGKTPDPAATAKTKNRAKNLARRAMKKAAMKEDVKPKSAQELNPGLQQRIDAASNAQKPRPLSGMRPIDKIKLMTRKEEVELDEANLKSKPVFHNGKEIGETGIDDEASPGNGKWYAKHHKTKFNSVGFDSRREAEKEVLAAHRVREEVELDEAFINGREYASHGLMHPKHAGEQIHQPSDRYVDFYASGTGDKMSGKVKSNNGKVVQIQAHPKLGDGKLHKFRVTANLPKMTNEAKDEGEYDYEGDMAMSQLKSVIKNAQKLHDMLEPNTNLPEWVQSKITLAEDYIVTAANYMDGEMNEEVEQIDELSSGLVRRYGGKAIRAHLNAKSKGDDATAAKRAKGINLASAKLYPGQHKNSPNKAKVAATNEDVEQIDELSKKTLSSYVGKAYWDQGKRMSKAGQAYGYIAATERRKATHGEIGNAIGGRKEVRRDKSRDKGVERALSRLAKEDYTIEASERDRYEEPKPKPPGRPTPIPNGLPGRPGNRPKPIPPMGALKKIEEKAKGYEKLASAIKNRAAKKKLAVEAHDPVGKEDADINNDGEVNNTDVFLHRKRRAIGKAIGTRLATKAGK